MSSESPTTDVQSAAEADGPARTTVRSELGRTLFVEAGAGTGKTTELVNRILAIVLAEKEADRVPLSRIAAITFTEAAAAELRERIRDQFESTRRAADANPDTDGNDRISDLCRQALEDSDVAAISTLHSFAQRLLSEFPVEVGLPPRVEVVDEVQSQLAFDDRWSNFVDQLFEDADIEQFILRASILGVGIGASGSPLRVVAQIFDDNWDRLENIDVPTPIAAPINWQPINSAITEILSLITVCTDPSDRLFQIVQRAELDRFLSATSDVERLRRLKPLSELKHGRSGVKTNWPNGKEGVADAVTGLVAEGQRLIEELADQTLSLLATRIASFTVAAASLRRAEGQLEFHDLLVLARQLLRQSPEARAALSERYRVLMLDEFQDTDPIQIEIALLLAGSSDVVPGGGWEMLLDDPGRLFMVGDPKQSIYRFRRADIELFLGVRERYSSDSVDLTRNFRSVAPVIEAVNGFFGRLMAEGKSSQAKYTPLTPTRSPSDADHRPSMFGGPVGKDALTARTVEAVGVASVIDDIVGHPERYPVLDLDTKLWRDPRLSDITILLPTRTSLGQLTEALDERGISYRADIGTLVYETQEVRELLSVLRAVDDPSDQVAMVATLRSSLYACGDDELLAWRHHGGKWDLGARIPDELADGTIAEAFRHLRSLSEHRWWHEPSALLMRIVEDRNVYALATGARRPRDTWRRIRYVIDQARAFSEAGGGDLRSYLRWTRLQGADGSKVHEPMLSEPDDVAVRIMTIHGSKGLEFPITIVSGLTTEAARPRKGVVVDWNGPGPTPGVSLRKGLRTAYFEAGADLEAEMDASEKDRLLYVAMTRARDHLFVSGNHRVAASGKATDSHGLVVYQHTSEHDPLDTFRHFEAGQQASRFGDSAAVDPLVGGDLPVPEPARWQVGRTSLLATASQPRVRSATALAQEVRDELPDRTRSSEDTEPWADDSETEGSLPPLTFRRGRAGTAIGSAVHGVLQLVNLTDPTESDIPGLVESQAWAESVPEFADTILASVRAALSTDIVRLCATVPHWKELYVAAPVGDLTVEGYIDLLVDTADGLVVVDYKTDSVRTDADVDRKLDGYSMQGAAYAVAIETAVGRPVVDIQFVFARPSGPIVRSVQDLDSLRVRVKDRAATA